MKGTLSLEQENEVRRSIRNSIQDQENVVMERFRKIINQTAFDLDPICVYVIMDKLRGQHNSANIPEKSYKKAEQMLKVLGVDRHWA